MASAEGTARPPQGTRRLLYAYWVTFVVVASYLWARWTGKLRTEVGQAEALRRLHLRTARRINDAIARLQGLFIKVGQLISIMTNFLPEEFRQQLTRLQDRVPPRPFEDIELRFREEFQGRGPLEVFAEFSSEPVASASIGQVHRARTHDGEQVAVKVQYPDIEDIVRYDLKALSRIFRIAHWFFPYHGLDGVFGEIRAMVLQELDFSQEAQSAERIAANFRARESARGAPSFEPSQERGFEAPFEPRERIGVCFPRLRRDLSTARVLTTGWVDGAKINDRARLVALGVNPSELARAVVTAYCQQIFSDGLYHADPHPGNLLVQGAPSGGTAGVRLCFLDFGAVAEVSQPMREGIVETIQAGLTRDTPRLVRAMRDMGFIARAGDQDIFERVIEFFHDKFQEEIKLETFSLRDVKFDPTRTLENLTDLRRMGVSLRDVMDQFHVPKEWILLERTVLLLLGLCTDLDPKLNPMTIIRPYLEEFVLGRERDWSQFLVETTREVGATALALPGDLRRFLQRAQRGQLEVRFRGLEDNARLLYALGQQLIFTACGIASGAAALYSEDRGQQSRAHLATGAAIASFALLFLSLWSTRARLQRHR